MIRETKKANNDPTARQGEFWRSRLDTTSSYGERSYLGSLVACIKRKSIYRALLRILALFRRFRMITYISTFISYALALIGTGAFLLVFLSAALLFLAASSILSFTFLLLTSFDARSSSKLLQKELSGKTVYLLFADGSYPLSKGSFFFGNALDLASREDSAVVIVTSAILTRRGRFLSLKRERENLFIIRKYYYFSFKKHVMRALSGKIVSIF